LNKLNNQHNFSRAYYKFSSISLVMGIFLRRLKRSLMNYF